MVVVIDGLLIKSPSPLFPPTTSIRPANKAFVVPSLISQPPSIRAVTPKMNVAKKGCILAGPEKLWKQERVLPEKMLLCCGTLIYSVRRYVSKQREWYTTGWSMFHLKLSGTVPKFFREMDHGVRGVIGRNVFPNYLWQIGVSPSCQSLTGLFIPIRDLFRRIRNQRPDPRASPSDYNKWIFAPLLFCLLYVHIYWRKGLLACV